MDITASFLQDLVENKKAVPKIFSKTTLSNETSAKLFPYQKNHVLNLISILLKYFLVLDTSDTGVGKTYMAAAACRELGRKPIIVCPKTLIPNWASVLEFYGVKYYDIVNYETLKNEKTYKDSNFRVRKRCPYIKKVDNDGDYLKPAFEWKVPRNAIIIFDESHRCKDPSTENGKLLMSSKQLIQQNIPVMLLSATICESYSDMKIPFYLMNFIPHTRNFNEFVRTLKTKYPEYRVRNRQLDQAERKTAVENAQTLIIFKEIKEYTSRIRIRDLGNQFPDNQWCAQQFLSDDSDKIAEAYEEIAELMRELEEKKTQCKNHLAKIQKLKQEIELRKIPIFIEQTQLYLEQGKSVIIFVNYINTMNILSAQLNIKCRICGDQTQDQRQESIALFQANIEKIIICQIRAGGVGISLHDLHGGHPRVTLLNFPDSASDLLQALGRAPRSGAKSPVLQRIILVANVEYEKNIMRSINKKLANISAINDGDLEGHKYQVNEGRRRQRRVLNEPVNNPIEEPVNDPVKDPVEDLTDNQPNIVEV
ncbi:putative ATP-dependent RNA helicase [Acanthamoeba polyphaga mimivirus]|nr:putative ATP-dependent RNA helicase [Mimivirus reunion]WMV61721.1 putative ATP-dependent RNA helicase [Mimivirus sp.]WMV62698.1 putative ATP-dependent RNA helicase [Acanthamoeba polyphaga mimivirus]WMV63675.1 putative ATP-dependent RNA helicase [Mimivirus sp.]